MTQTSQLPIPFSVCLKAVLDYSYQFVEVQYCSGNKTTFIVKGKDHSKTSIFFRYTCPWKWLDLCFWIIVTMETWVNIRLIVLWSLVPQKGVGNITLLLSARKNLFQGQISRAFTAWLYLHLSMMNALVLL